MYPTQQNMVTFTVALVKGTMISHLCCSQKLLYFKIHKYDCHLLLESRSDALKTSSSLYCLSNLLEMVTFGYT